LAKESITYHEATTCRLKILITNQTSDLVAQSLETSPNLSLKEDLSDNRHAGVQIDNVTGIRGKAVVLQGRLAALQRIDRSLDRQREEMVSMVIMLGAAY
jgi:hypothetical protein